MPDRGAFVIPIHDLDLEGRSVRFPITVAWLRGALEECEAQPAGTEGQVNVHLTKTGNEVLVQGQIDAALTIPCARCLNPVELRPHVELALLLRPVPGGAAPLRQVAGASGNRAAYDARLAAKAAERASRGGGDPKAQGASGGGAGQAGARDAARSTPRSSKSDDETEFDGEDADIDTYEGEEVVLDRFVREAILLESPIFPLCSEACEGIRPASDSATDSQDAVTDPRLLPLLELAKRRKMKE